MVATRLVPLGLTVASLAGQAIAQSSSLNFSFLTMNVAGLPSILNSNDESSDKTSNSELIGTYFATYNFDAIHVQEDFNYHAYIYSTDNHAYRTSTSGGAGIGSGLNSLAHYDWLDFTRIKWDDCSNDSEYDCWTPKGFTFMRMHLDTGVYIDFYNLHADAGTEDGDEEARTANIEQVVDYMETYSVGNAVIVAGDTNSRYTRTADNIRILSTEGNMTDVWVELERDGTAPAAGADAITCDNPSTVLTCETVDKVFYKGNDMISLSAFNFSYEAGMFLTTDGDTLTDHNPIMVNFTYTLSDSIRQSDQFGGPHGTYFNDLPSLPTSPKTSSITVSGGNRLDSVSLTLSDSTTFTHGGSGGTSYSLTLGDSEYWTEAKLCEGKYNSHTRNFYIKVTTSDGNTISAGKTTSDCETFTAPDGFQIVGFYGRDGDEMDRIGFIYAPQ
ncbi:MAG: hypothetical protein M1834_003196 [Cirrosporium novae-zelandiae]|nr:MAG: hypothetical protein M1834_003196 [Cirrosporium novae-zelandiae]